MTAVKAKERPAVGRLLQYWRQVRRMSQLALATEARVTPRHVSFVESGRASPSREMVLTLASTLDLPLRDRNQLLLAAGYAPLYRDTDLDQPAMDPVRAAIDRVLAQHEPYPAVVLSRHWDVLRTNESAAALFGWLLGPAAGAANVLTLMFDPRGLRPHVANWPDVAQALVQRVHREAVGGVPDPRTTALLEEVLTAPGVPERWRAPDFTADLLPVVPVEFAKDDRSLRYFSMVTTVGTPQDIAAQEIRLECFFPTDDPTAAHRW
ncbi:MAG: helix-turn-helix domain-containing protein [Actinophytocola sp.]|uniref:helix-turn-helix domain-containing protein n=1 Tax=Actinophytocola sp. TaxID=1872138 RepID=UPI003D6C0914